MSTVLLDVRDLLKRFQGLIALRRVHLRVHLGEIVSIIGANGSGKTTLLDCIQGLSRPDEGEIYLDGQPLVGQRLDQIVRAGVARTYQRVRLFGQMTAAEQVLTGMHCRLRTGLLGALLRTGSARYEERQAWHRAQWWLDHIGLGDKAHYTPDMLSYEEQRRLELARALATEPRLLLLDEPTAGLEAADAARMADLILRLRSELGLTILLAEHNLSVVRAISDRAALLEYGQLTAEGSFDMIWDRTQMRESYFGPFYYPQVP